MVVKVVGIQRLDFTANDGNQIKGQKIHYVYHSDNGGVTGQLTDTVFIRDGSSVRLPLFDFSEDCMCEFVYDFNGKRAVLSEVRLVE